VLIAAISFSETVGNNMGPSQVSKECGGLNEVFLGTQPRQVINKLQLFRDQLHIHHQDNAISLCAQLLLLIYPHHGLVCSWRRVNSN
jgi:hypothetical protein